MSHDLPKTESLTPERIRMNGNGRDSGTSVRAPAARSGTPGSHRADDIRRVVDDRSPAARPAPLSLSTVPAARNGTTARRSATSLPANGDHPMVLAILRPGASERQVQRLVQALRALELTAHVYEVGHGVLMLDGLAEPEVAALLAEHTAVERLVASTVRYHLADRAVAPAGSVVPIGQVPFGGNSFAVIAGPCAVEGHDQLLAAAWAAKAAGATVLRGGAFKPRSSPYLFQGLGLAGVELLAQARAATGLPFVTEIMDPAQLEAMYPLVDGFQVGARNMQNFELLKALGDVDKPVLLKRNPGATVEEWLLAAEYLLAGGNSQVILCERGIRTFNTTTRFTLDLASVALAKRATHLPVIVDPSHATGDPTLVAPMTRAALAAGADGAIIEMHTDPAHALSDGFQALLPNELAALIEELARIAPVLGRTLAASPGSGRTSARSAPTLAPSGPTSDPSTSTMDPTRPTPESSTSTPDPSKPSPPRTVPLAS